MARERDTSSVYLSGDLAHRADGGWGGWVYAVDADSGIWRRRLRSNYPIVAAA